MSALKIEIELLSETCLSGGAALLAGDVDAELDVNDLGLPRMRGRTLKGLLVEEAASILRVLEPEGNGTFHSAALNLFGQPGNEVGCLSFHDGGLRGDVEALIRARKWPATDVTEALSVIRRQTTIDEETGAAKSHSLRSSRLLRAGLKLEAPVTATKPLTIEEKALLASCVAGLRHVGLHRNRGWGEVKARLLDGAEDDVTGRWMPGLLDRGATEQERTVQTRPSSATMTKGRCVVKLVLHLESPALLAGDSNDPSTVETLPYIPGTSLLGAAAARWLALNPTPDPALHPRFRELFLDGNTRWLNAYLTGDGERRLTPVPLSLTVEKYASGMHVAWDRAALGYDWRAPDRTGVPHCFVDLPYDDSGEPVGWKRPTYTMRLHHQREREAGRATTGNLYAHVALEAGQQFATYILCETGEAAAEIERLMKAGPLTLGRSKTAGYGGHATLKSLRIETADAWNEILTLDDADRIVVTLLSDFAGSSMSGRCDPGTLVETLRTVLGIDPTVSVDVYATGRLSGGWVSVWRMPRPAQRLVKAGSVVVFDTSVVDDDRRRQLVWNGIGGRRAEGFGRIAVNAHGSRGRLQLRQLEPTSHPSTLPPVLSDAAQWLQGALLERALHRALVARGPRDAEGVMLNAGSSQIAQLRTVLHRATSIHDFMAGLPAPGRTPGARFPAKKLWTARLRGKPIHQWLLDLCNGGLYETDDARQCSKALGIPLSVLDERQRWRLLRAFLDAFLDALRRRAREWTVR